ncbi:hypothetical protein BC830DRAFT_1157778 [Chytriomyces sp. MP71]|nr:hypothetical protein BC830DRAFT_1157778 [Chytriomyces sp. MP71]
MSCCCVCQDAILTTDSRAVVTLEAGAGETHAHGECFACACCLEPLSNEYFCVSEGARLSLLCRADYLRQHGNRCAHVDCGEVIDGRAIAALGKKWHEAHFACRSCGKGLGATFICKHSHPLCLRCSNRITLRKEADHLKPECATCHRPIDDPCDEMVTFKGRTVHAAHFQCAVCGCVLTSKCREIDGRLVCLPDAELAYKGDCRKCSRPVRSERHIVALGGVFHIECFVCAKCDKPFTTLNYREHKGNPYCDEHYNHLMGHICAFCNEVSTGRVITAVGRSWCEDHFLCHTCHCNLVETKFTSWDTKPVCKRCYDALPRRVREALHRRTEMEKKKVKPASTSAVKGK